MRLASQSAAPSSLEAHLGYWLRLVSNHVSARFQQLVETQEGCSVTEWVALRALYDRSATTHADLIQALGMTKGATSKIVSRLEERGLAKRTLVPGRHRDQVIVLTAKGLKLVPRLAACADANDAHFFGHLSPREIQTLMHTCQSLVAHHHLPGPAVD